MTDSLRLELIHDRRLCYAMQQNAVPLAHLLRLHNDGAEALRDLTVRLELLPELSTPWTARIEQVPASSTYNLDQLPLQLRPEALANAIERQAANLRVEVHIGDHLVAAADHAVDVLAYNEWPGAGTLPALLAAFVLPNHPALAPVLRAASDRLAAATGSGALDGYQSRDPARAQAIARALFEALQQRGIAYVHPPPSFEQHGQKVRTPDQVLGERLGTCLDLALAYAACLEQAGLHPLLVVGEGHAVAGAWLVDEGFAEPTPADPLPLRKRVELGRIALVECTALCSTQAAPFASACQHGARTVAAEGRFLFAVDVRSARKTGMRPLPARTAAFAAGDAAQVAAQVDAEVADEVAPVPAPLPAPEPAETPPENRLGRWQRRLLDLSLRNRLLAFVEGKRTIPLLVPDLAGWVAALEGGAEFRVHGAPDVAAEALPAFLRAELGSRRLRAPLAPDDLERRLLEVFRQARTAMEESGVGTLFLAVGFLRWFETEASKEPRRAPLFLLPLRLERLSLAEGFVLALADEEPRVNETLLQKLEHDFAITVRGLGGGDDDDGPDVAAVLDAFRKAVVDVARWEVEPTACLGCFSFAKYLMWVDLAERRGELLAHPFLQHLVETPGQAFAQPGDWPDASAIDQRDPAELLCPKDADSSQLGAVLAASAGRSFVLEGPPGTGKSQTITNLIAQCLAAGQRVLFVAEKRAALEVVHKRLGEVGLAPFCLELHSGKGSKRDVSRQLGRALELALQQEPGQWRQKATELLAARSKLNAYVTALHRTRGPGCSVFSAMAAVVEHRELPQVDGLPVDGDAAAMQQRRELVDALAASASPLGEIAAHAWSGAGLAQWSPALLKDLPPLFEALAAAADGLEWSSGPALAALGFAAGDSASSRDGLARSAALAGLLAAGPLPAELLAATDFAARQKVIAGLCAAGLEAAGLTAQLAERWRPGLLALDVVALRTQLLRWEPKFALLRWWKLRPVKKTLHAASSTDRLPLSAQLHQDLETTAAVRAHYAQIERAAADVGPWLGAVWRGLDTDWGALQRLVERCQRVRELAAGLAPAGEALATLLRRCAAIADGSDAAGVTALADLHAAHRSFDSAMAALSMLQLDLLAAFGPADAPDFVEAVRQRLARWSSALPSLRSWCALRRDVDAAAARGLGPLVAALTQGQVQAVFLRPVFERSFAESWLAATLPRDPALASFRGLDHERAIARFRALDEELIALAGKVVLARLCAAVPAIRSTNAESSELGILLRELKKQRRHLSPRQLFARIPNLLSRLAPCLLMSPLTVAQVLGRSMPPFQLVVFDEASQVPVWDAVGAIGRARALVVVGDSRQLPPTTFFQRLDGDDPGRDDDEAVDELESVLDECGAAGLHRLHLRWHYRSQHESLIAFSNHHYYDNKLFTFPAADRGRALGVQLVPVAGVYDRARSQQNRIEAEALVAALVERLRAAGDGRTSYGVVTFSQSQQTLVEDLLEQARALHPEIERHFAAAEEPVFVKNLENVQGDERDVMLFSICYGPDAAGKVHMNFGPLNQQAGERRLNVAITRARRELLVFSSLRAEQIELQRTNSTGVRHLRAFLDYAARGVQAITEALQVDPARSCETPFERSVQAALQQLGHEVHPQVGCSGYRLDLAVVDPRAPGRYLLGVECDGAAYHSAVTARDRDRLRQGVLERLGWKLCRVWSTDWWLDPAGETARLQHEITAALSRPLPVSRPVVVAAPAPAAAAPAVDGAPVAGEGAGSEPAAAAATAADVAVSLPVYKPAHLGIAGDSDDFFDPQHDARVRAQVRQVLAAEAPLGFDLLVRRLGDAWSLSRVTDRVRDRVRAALPDEVREHAGVLWPPAQDPSLFTDFRTSPPGIAVREAEHLPAIEVANAMAWLLVQHGSMAADELLREAARLFGFTRLGSSLRVAMSSGLELLVARGAAGRDGDAVQPRAVATPPSG